MPATQGTESPGDVVPLSMVPLGAGMRVQHGRGEDVTLLEGGSSRLGCECEGDEGEDEDLGEGGHHGCRCGFVKRM